MLPPSEVDNFTQNFAPFSEEEEEETEEETNLHEKCEKQLSGRRGYKQTDRQTNHACCNGNAGLASSLCGPFLNQLVRHDYLGKVNECFWPMVCFVPQRGKGKSVINKTQVGILSKQVDFLGTVSVTLKNKQTVCVMEPNCHQC